jgi:hypothetical protein
MFHPHMLSVLILSSKLPVVLLWVFPATMLYSFIPSLAHTCYVFPPRSSALIFDSNSMASNELGIIVVREWSAITAGNWPLPRILRTLHSNSASLVPRPVANRTSRHVPHIHVAGSRFTYLMRQMQQTESNKCELWISSWCYPELN